MGTVALPGAGGGFDLALGGWRIAGREGQDALRARMPGYALDVRLDGPPPPGAAPGRPAPFPGPDLLRPGGLLLLLLPHPDGPQRHPGGGRRAPAGRRAKPGWTTSGGTSSSSAGAAGTGSPGTLRDGRDLTVSIVRDPAGTVVLSYGTLVEPGGETRHLPPSAFVLEPSGQWTSPHTGIRYPSGWRLRVPGGGTRPALDAPAARPGAGHPALHRGDLLGGGGAPGGRGQRGRRGAGLRGADRLQPAVPR